jgi:hypothetical protein
MRKWTAILTALVFLLSTSAFGFSGTDYPLWDGASSPANSLHGNIGGQNLLLKLDETAEYSNVADGMAQICFFAFDKAEQNYLEMYLLLPEGAAAGDVFSAASSGMSSISLYEVSKTGDDLYFSGQVSGFAYPSNSSFELSIDFAERSDSALTMRGSLEGTLVKFKENSPTEETLVLSGVKFDFTLPMNAAHAPKASPAPEVPVLPSPSAEPQQSPMPQLPVPFTVPKAPQATLDPHPAFTLPPNYAVL